jgi:non-heme chloroperoxidase
MNDPDLHTEPDRTSRKVPMTLQDQAGRFTTRRRLLAAMAAGTTIPRAAGPLAASVATTTALVAAPGRAAVQPRAIHPAKGPRMTTITTRDGTEIFYKDWGEGQPVVFSHGWPLSSDAWEDQMFFLASRGYRCIAHNRRGHGRSQQTWHGNDLDTYADDLADLVQALDLRDAVHVGHSTGGGEVARYIGRHGTSRVAKAVLVSAIPPFMLRTDTNPTSLPKEDFDRVRAAVLADRTQFWRDLSLSFFGYNRSGAEVSEGVREQFVSLCMMTGFPASYLGIKAWSETDLTEDLKRIDVPTLVLHGDDDQLVPIANSALRSAKIIPEATLKIYEGGSHGIAATHKDRLNRDLLAFIGE